MHWIFEHFQILVLLAAALAYWMNRRRGEAEEEGGTRRPSAGRTLPSEGQSDSMDERVRRIQEEVRRKVQERRSGIPLPPPLPDAGLLRTPTSKDMPRSSVPPPPARRPRAAAPTAVAMAEARQERQWDEELRRAEERRRESRRLAKAAEGQALSGAASGRPLAPTNVVASLHDASSLRQAVILKEILGPPVGLR